MPGFLQSSAATGSRLVLGAGGWREFVDAGALRARRIGTSRPWTTSEKLVGRMRTWGTKPRRVRSDGCSMPNHTEAAASRALIRRLKSTHIPLDEPLVSDTGSRIWLRSNVPDGDELVRVQATRLPSGAQANSPFAKGVTCGMLLTTRPVATDTVSGVERARGGSWPVKNERRRPSRDQWRSSPSRRESSRWSPPSDP